MMSAPTGPPIDTEALNRVLDNRGISHAEFGRQSGLSESHVSYILSGRILYPRKDARDKLRDFLAGLPLAEATFEVDNIIPPVECEESNMVLWIKGDLAETRHRLKVAVAQEDTTIKQYIVDLFDHDPHPLAIIRAAQRQASQKKMSLERWVDSLV